MTAADRVAEQEAPRWVRRLRAWHRRAVIGELDLQAVLERIHADSGWSSRFAFMVLMSAGIAILGLLLSSPAVIIGAMLISPLMGPIIGLGFALAVLDWAEARSSLLALLLGSLLAVSFTAMVVALSPLQDLTPEILARTRPNLFDLLVAIFSALAGGYATVKGRGETIVGVAIATALMPPLAVVGYGLATGNAAVFTGSLALFITNFVAIALSATCVARFYGFGSALSPNQTRQQVTALVVVVLALAVPLAVSLRQIAWEAWATRTARAALEREFGDGARVSSFDPTFGDPAVRIRATVLTEQLRDKAGADLEQRLSDALGQPVRLTLSQVLVNQGATRAELDRARAAAEEARNDQLARADMAARLALVAGAPAEAVLVDPETRVATARAEGSRTLAELQAAEARLAADSPGWTVRLLPPAGPLPALAVPAEGLDTGSDGALDALAWALERLGTNRARLSARRLSGEPAGAAGARADAVAEALKARGILVEVAPAEPVDAALERDAGRIAAGAVAVMPLAPAPALPEAAEDPGEAPEAAG